MGLSILALLVCFLSFGCTATNQSTADRPIPASKDPASYGTVTSRVERGVTPQAEVLELFGGPNIATTNSDGEEVWVYERVSTSSTSGGWSEARKFGAFLGFGLAADSSKYGSQSNVSTQSLTIIIKFDERKRVRDYAVRSTTF